VAQRDRLIQPVPVVPVIAAALAGSTGFAGNG
jgi:hypothetical protein